MRKITNATLFVIVFVNLFLARVPVANACVQWGDPVCSTGEPIGACSGDYITPCLDGWVGIGVCPPNTYSCNRASDGYCCPLGTGTPSCFLPGTEIETGEGETKKIEEIAVGDEVLSFANDRIVNSSVSRIYKSRRDYYFELTAEDYSVKVTAEHPFYIGNNQFEEVKNLKIGDILYVEKNGELIKKRVTSKEKIDKKVDVYNMTVDNTNTYFANNFAVHNKLGNRVCNNPFAVNCPAGTVKTNVATGSECIGNGRIAACGLGNAQALGGGCDWGGGTPGTCNWEPCPKRNNPNKMCKVCEGGTEDYYRGTDVITYRCDPICDANAWGAWSACSVSCGGGTQTRTNACGSTQGQVCNTQSCQGPWWQVKDGDITTNGDIISRLPSGKYLNLVGSGGFPGVPVYKDSIGVAPGTISTTLWNANTTTSLSRIFDYSYFENLIPDTIVFNDISKLTTGVGVTTDLNGYEWYKITGSLDTVGNIDFGSRKVILFIEGNLNINGNINLTDNSGFFVSFVSGKINIAGTVTSLEGIYDSGGNFSTGVGTSQLLVRGSVVSYGGITMQRDLADDSVTPAELFEFAPDQFVLFPEKLKFSRTKWAEVAP